MTKTTNYQLNQWAKSDRIRMDDFNADNAKIDAALGAMPKIGFGSYSGNSAENRTIALGYTPKAVLLFDSKGYTYRYYGGEMFYGGLALENLPVRNSNGTLALLQIVDNGFSVFNADNYYFLNRSGETYYYLTIY